MATMDIEILRTCNYSDELINTAVTVNHTCDRIILPILLILDVIGRSFSLYAYYNKSKTESAYMYQIFVDVAQFAASVSYFLHFYLRIHFDGYNGQGQLWFMKCSACMGFIAHFTNPFEMGMKFLAQLLSVAMTCDRIYALARPVEYRKRSYKRSRPWIALAICAIFAFIASFYVGFYFMVQWNDQKEIYENVRNMPWNFLLSLLISIKDDVTMVLAVLLIVLNLILAKIYKKHMIEKGAVTNSEVEELKKAKLLFYLTTIQCSLNVLGVSGDFFYQMMAWLAKYNPPRFYCPYKALDTFMITPFVFMLSSSLDFCICFVFMPTFRQMILKSLRRKRNHVVPLTGYVGDW